MAKLSIIIPVYNTLNEFLEECLTSIFESTLKDIEVIVVDDGSNKDYSKLKKKYLNKIKYFKTENQGTLKARLYGVKQATAPYVAYVDSDGVPLELANAVYKYADGEHYLYEIKIHCYLSLDTLAKCGCNR